MEEISSAPSKKFSQSIEKLMLEIERQEKNFYLGQANSNSDDFLQFIEQMESFFHELMLIEKEKGEIIYFFQFLELLKVILVAKEENNMTKIYYLLQEEFTPLLQELLREER